MNTLQAGAGERRYVPAIGARVRLKSMADYHGHSLPAWSTLHATGVNGDVVTCIRSLTENGANDGELVSVDLASIETPIGWKPRYTIHATADTLEQVLSWFRDARGIAVLQSHYMPTCPTSFAPADNYATADWRFNGADVDLVDASQCVDVFRVVKLETGEPCVSVECEYCHGTGTYTQYGGGIDGDTLRPRVVHSGKCNCTDGKRARGFSELDAKQRKVATRELEAAGWKIWYQRSGAMWRMERETVVKEFGASVPPSEVNV